MNLLVYLATLTVQGYAILSVTEFNIDGSKPRVAYASNKDFKKIVKYYSKMKAFDGKDDFSEKKLNKTLDTLSDIKDDYKAFKDEFWSNTDDVKKALNTAMDEISENLNDKDYDYDR